jgi:outer membrane murein-binding lipoprotein Lpp
MANKIKAFVLAAVIAVTGLALTGCKTETAKIPCFDNPHAEECKG